MRATCKHKHGERAHREFEDSAEKRGLFGGGASHNATLNALSGVFALKTSGLKNLDIAVGDFLKERLDIMELSLFFDDTALDDWVVL